MLLEVYDRRGNENMKQSKNFCNQRGNVLFLILIAVALFAALSYAVTSSTRSSGASPSAEKIQTSIADMLDYFTTLNTAFMRLTVSGGYSPEQVSFGYDQPLYGGTTETNAYHNASCTTTRCRMFHPDGGGIPARIFSSYGVKSPNSYNADYSLPGAMNFILFKWPDAGSEKNDIVAYIDGITPEICEAINAQSDILNTHSMSGTWIGVENVAGWDNSSAWGPGNAADLKGKTIFGSQAQGSGSGRWCSVFHLVLAR